MGLSKVCAIVFCTSLAVTLATPGQVHADAAIHHPGLPTQIGAVKSTDFMHARYYSPNLGRFVSVDPLGGTVWSSQSWNRYAYALNNPGRMVDPTGEGNVDVIARTQSSRLSMSGSQKENMRKADAFAAGTLLALGGTLATGGSSNVWVGLSLGGTWNVAGGSLARQLDCDPSTMAFDSGSMFVDGMLGVLGTRAGISVLKWATSKPWIMKGIGLGGARLTSEATSLFFPTATQEAIDEAVDTLWGSGILDDIAAAMGDWQVTTVTTPNETREGENSEPTVTNVYVTSGPPRMIEYIRSNHG